MRNWRTYVRQKGSRRVILALIICLSTGMVPLTLLLVKQELIKRAGDTVALGAADIADKLDIVLAERLGDIQAFAHSPFLTGNNHAQALAYLEELHRIYPIYRRLSIVDREGRLIASTDSTAQDGSTVSPAMLQTTLHQTGPHVEILRRADGPGGSLDTVRFSARLHGPETGSQGVVVSEIDQRTFRLFVTQTTQHEQRSSLNPAIQEFDVLSPSGDLLLTSDKQTEHVAARRLPGPAVIRSKAGYVEEYADKNGRNALTGYARMDGSAGLPDLQWTILVRVDRAEVLESIWAVLWKLIGIAEICLIPLLGLFYWSRHRQSVEEAEAALARRALEANEVRIRKIVDIALDAVITIDERGLVTGWNPQAEQIFGWAAGEVIGRPLTHTIIPPAYRDAHERGLRHYAATGAGPVLNTRIEITALHRSGREFPVELAITPMHLDGRTVFSAFLLNITERKQAEDELRRTKTAAESANQAKTEFLANMSHELRTPLNAIVGTSDVLLKTSLTPEQRQCALMSQRAGQVLLRLVNDVLDLAKIEAGTLRVESAPFDLDELLERTKRLMELRPQRPTVVFSFAVAPDVPTQLEGDGFRLQQILFNLLGNALKFTEQGSVSLAVSRVTTDEHRPELRFAISDTGISIPADRLDHIFGRFTQVDSGDNRKYGGAGLGLSICKQLVQLMQGSIQVASEVGKGSTFTVVLPFTVATADTDTAASIDQNDPAKSHAAPTNKASHTAPTVLLIDDSAEIGQLAGLYVNDTPYRLDHATNGPTAIRLYRAHPYDLIFLDLQMPDMDGYATANAIRTWEDAQGISRKPIIALTADVLGPARERSRQAGCTGFIGKPFSQATFLAAIHQYIRTPDRQTAPGQAAQETPATRLIGEEELDGLSRKFLHNRQRDLRALASALAAHDWTTIQTIGHRIKGLAGSYGFEDVGAIRSRLEQAAGEQAPDRIASEMEQLEQSLQRLDPSHERAA